MSGIASIALTLAMFGAFALVWGGITVWRKQGDRKRGILMLVAAAVLIANVAILTV